MLIYGTQSVLKLWTICHVTELDLNYHSKLIYECKREGWGSKGGAFYYDKFGLRERKAN